MVLWQVREFWVCCLWAVRSLLKIAVSPAVHFYFERNKPDLLSGLNAEEKNKTSVEIWWRKVVRRGKTKWWIKVSSVLPGNTNQLFEVMTQGKGAFGCEWARLESILQVHEHGPMSRQGHNKDCTCQRALWCSQWNLECTCSDCRQSNGFCRF